MHRKVARIVRQAGSGQSQTELGGQVVSPKGRRKWRSSLGGQPGQPGQPEFRSLIGENTIRDEFGELSWGTRDPMDTRSSHVRLRNGADQADQPDQARETAAFRGRPQQNRPDQTRLGPDHLDSVRSCPAEPWANDPAEYPNWAATPELAEPIASTDRPDVISVVEDLADDGMRPGKISRTLGLTRVEVLVILRRTGR
jgi:hypothetical protein